MTTKTHQTEPHRSALGRRRFVRDALSLAGVGATAGLTRALPRSAKAASADPTSANDRKLLFVVCAAGGASIIDSFLPISADEAGSEELADTLDTYPSDWIVQPPDSEIRCVRALEDTSYYTTSYSMADLLSRHYRDMLVVTHEVTSVNHAVAQKRAVTGADVNGGRTISEAVAEIHGASLPLANVNMAVGGYAEPGGDPSLPVSARAEFIAAPRLFALATDGTRAISGAPDRARMDQIRQTRLGFEQAGAFSKTFRAAPLLEGYLEARERARGLEELELFDELLLFANDEIPTNLGLSPSPMLAELLSVFPRLAHDQWEQQAALSFLLAYYGVTVASTLSVQAATVQDGDDLISTPLAFDFSHTDHRTAQNVMWGRISLVLDGLITLLKSFDYLGDPSQGKMWDRSLIYVATDFGRDKVRPAGANRWGTGHDLNNGSLLISPLLQGNRIFGGVDPTTGLTHGFDPRTGQPDRDAQQREGDIYSVIAQAMGVDFPGRRDMSALVR
ncbi:MAG: hypothetical protein AAGF11_42605 [Myxococcota bacterium]